VNRAELVKAVSNKTQIPQSDVEEVIAGVLDVLSLALSVGEAVNLRTFGKFETVERKPFVRRHPSTGELIKVPSKKAVAFRPGRNLSNHVNNGK
jgi:nucleoid DNA-binding protein